MSTKSSRHGSDGMAAMLSLPAPRWRGGGIGPLWTVFTLTLRQFLRGRRALAVLALALLPGGLAVLVRTLAEQAPRLVQAEFGLLFNLVPHALLPLTALLYGSGMILDEQEDQTLTYLLIRPLPKWGLYLTKLLASMCMVAMLAAVFVVVTDLAIYAGSSEWGEVFPVKMLLTLCVMSLAIVAYVAVFAAISLFVQRSLIVGIVYIALVEGLLSNFEFALRQLTVMYYFRVLSLRWLGFGSQERQAWGINLTDAPSSLSSVLTLLAIAAGTTIIAMRIFSRREFYVKTPETN